MSRVRCGAGWLAYHPLAYVPLLGVEADAYLYQSAAVHGVGDEVAFLVNLLQGGLGGVVQLELEDVDDVLRLHHGVRPSVRTAHFGVSELAHELEDDEEDNLVVPLVVLALQFVGVAGEEGAQAGEEGVDVAALQLLGEETDVELRFVLRHGGVEGGGKVEEAILHFVVGEAEGVHFEAVVVVLYRQIPALVDHRHGVVYVGAVVLQGGVAHLDAVHQPQVEVGLLQHLGQEGGGAAGEPVVVEGALLQGVEHAEGVVHRGEVLACGEAVAVVLAGHQLHYLVGGEVVFLPHRFHFGLEGGDDFLLRQSAQGVVIQREADVLQLVQVTEDAHLGELRDPGDEDELQPRVGILQYGVEGGEHLAEVILQVGVVEVSQQGLVVFVDEDNDAASGLLAGLADDGHEADGDTVALVGRASVEGLPLAELAFEEVLQHFAAVVPFGIEAEVQHGVHVPVLLQLFDGEAVEEFALAQEVGFQCG